MAQWNEVQRNFSGGVISPRMVMREDLEQVHPNSVLEMSNFLPTLQGTAVRTPGSRFMNEIRNNSGDVPSTVRIIPFLSPLNEQAYLEITPRQGDPAVDGDIRVKRVTPDITQAASQLAGRVAATGNVFENFIINGNMDQGAQPWSLDPPNPGFGTGGDGSRLGGWKINDSNFEVYSTRGSIEQEFEVLADTSTLLVQPQIGYQIRGNFDGTDNPLVIRLKIGTSRGASDILDWDLSDFMIKGAVINPINEASGTFTAGQKLWYRIEWDAVQNIYDWISTFDPFLTFFRLSASSSVPGVPPVLDDLTGVVPYTASELKEVQYIQSPYDDGANWDPLNPELTPQFGKFVVFVHPNHPPYEFYFDGVDYVFQAKEFENAPSVWAQLGYPRAVTSFNGRLVLGGSVEDIVSVGDPRGIPSEKVWCTEVGKWWKFTDTSDPDYNPVATDSVEFTATFRSPIQWLYGQKNILIGAKTVEYNASGDAILSPEDLGISLQSTHGSAPVQPVGMGQFVLFPAENGSKVRALQYFADDESWISPDMTLWYPELFGNSEIVRMVRMRNPHQLCLCLRKNGSIGILSQDPHAGISGWSVLTPGSTDKIIDICTLVDDEGRDVLLIAIERLIDGQYVTYTEAIVNWYDGGQNVYMNSHELFILPTPSNIITGVDHLEGRRVQVIVASLADPATPTQNWNGYIGEYEVSGGVIELLDDRGEPIVVTAAVVGLAITSELVTLPLVTMAPDSRKRYHSILVRSLASIRPQINGERDQDFNASTTMSRSQPRDLFYDSEISNFGWDEAQFIQVIENLPFKLEVLGIFGQVEAHKV